MDKRNETPKHIALFDLDEFGNFYEPFYGKKTLSDHDVKKLIYEKLVQKNKNHELYYSLSEALYQINFDFQNCNIDQNNIEFHQLFSTRDILNKKESFKIGEGTLGQAVKDQQTHIMDPAPLGYMKVGSGLGEKDAASVIAKPLVIENVTVGLIELAFLRGIDNKITDLLDNVAPTIAAAINSAITRDKVNELLETTQEQSHKMREQQEKLTEVNEELEAQQEELRQANEELQEQTLQLQQSEEELRTQQEEIMQINRELEEKAKQLEIKNLSIIEQNGEMELAKRDLEKKADELETTSRYKSEFLANMSHELRTPLTVISGYLEMLADADLNPAIARAIQQMGEQSERMKQLVNDLLHLSKLESNNSGIGNEWFKFNPVCAEIVDQLKAYTPATSAQESFPQVKIQCDCLAGSDISHVEIFGFEDELKSILTNLITNAIKYGHKKGQIAEVRVEINLTSLGLEVAIKDKGNGIEASHISRLTERFYRIDESRESTVGGTGLGLAIVRHALGHHDSQLKIESTLGVGSCFSFIIPSDRIRVEK